ncbi:hypothetical protein CONLIGDRAFT_692484 [Coniochaeta ligniaria NRRL 30616]|uniref:SAP domain-containing protein n=1 Tax=Coniochaeta ligniaria NRRL 30616 TaxID=1408157 RepID=A0A1J7J556_9PEZI|nr:hypothetical protein CONLIGDRAFT_692484 [Coniochaeta ligniaria NRRL 30616]
MVCLYRHSTKCEIYGPKDEYIIAAACKRTKSTNQSCPPTGTTSYTSDELIAFVRGNSRLATYLKTQEQQASATASAQKAYATLTDKLIDAWGESQLKEFCDTHGINVPQGTKTQQLRALVRKHRAEILDNASTASASAASAYGAATSKAGNAYTQATDKASIAPEEAFNDAVNT